ncbi:hypothetical protein [Streptomyces iranensis]|uniref:Uncharacterized protein n=1 Tax=Streptomyces iranensis TaxID=576784 RepID=A0ABS4N6I0_9ACTN|nr:hypothetical protein [Streptomyces iranensis]MBP2067608.1 hypothetical protein [Streptomyces iranensis]
MQTPRGPRRLSRSGIRRAGESGFVLGLGGLAGLQRDRVRGQGPGPQGRGQPGDRKASASRF